MKNLNENEMVMVYGGSINLDAWDNSYNCLKCRDLAGQVINMAVITAAIGAAVGSPGGPQGAIAGAIGGAILSVINDRRKAAEAIDYCIACVNDIFE